MTGPAQASFINMGLSGQDTQAYNGCAYKFKVTLMEGASLYLFGRVRRICGGSGPAHSGVESLRHVASVEDDVMADGCHLRCWRRACRSRCFGANAATTTLQSTAFQIYKNLP
jgi:hypothetical protein